MLKKPTHREIETVDTFQHLPSLQFRFHNKPYAIVQHEDDSFSITNKERTELVDNSLILGIEYVFESSSTIEEVEDKIHEITFVSDVEFS